MECVHPGKAEISLHTCTMSKDNLTETDQIAHRCCNILKWVLRHMRQQRPRLDCASEQPHQGLSCPPTESLDTIECINGEQVPG